MSKRNETTVLIPGTGRTIDLLTIPLNIAVEVLNAHNTGVRIIQEHDACWAPSETQWHVAEVALLRKGRVYKRKDGTLAIRKGRANV